MNRCSHYQWNKETLMCDRCGMTARAMDMNGERIPVPVPARVPLQRTPPSDEPPNEPQGPYR